jgi:transcriptional regulator with XRE-family HTH domain
MNAKQALFYMHFGINLRQLREANGWSRKHVAIGVGVHVNTIQNTENGKYGLTLEKYARLCEFFDISLSLLLPTDLV